MPTPLTIIVPVDASRLRIDRWLATQLADHSRSEIQRWIDERRISVRGMVVKSGYKLLAGETLTIDAPVVAKPNPMLAQAIALAIVYEDNDMLVIDKPAGMVVHPAPGHYEGTVINALLYHLPDIAGVGGEQRPGLVHRLDKDTSGLLLIAKHDRALRYLQAQFQDRTVYKEYLALVEGRLHPENGRISAALGRHPNDRQRFAVLPGMYKWVDGELVASKHGKEATTDYETLAVYQSRVQGLETTHPFSLMRIVLHTGRTHQIRVHFAWQKHPLVGDTMYGPSKPRLPIERQFLHAHKLRIKLPSSGQEHEFVAPLAEDLRELLASLEQKNGD